VQSSAGTLVYLDSRMRYEGLDQALISHVERRDLGWTDEQLGDPFIVDAERAVSSAPPPKQVPEWAMMTPTGYEMQPYPGQQYGGQPYPAQPYGAPQYPAPPQYQGQPYQGQPSAVPQYPAQQAPPLPPYAQQPAAPQPPTAPQPPATFTPPPAYSPPASPPAESADSTWAAPGTGGEGAA